MTKAKATTRKRPTVKPQQAELKGMGRKRDDELDSMILALHKVRTKRIKLLADEVAMAATLLEKMKAKKMKAYVCWDGDLKYPCTVMAGTEKVKVACEEA